MANTYPPGTKIRIKCQVKSNMAVAVQAKLLVYIYEGSILPGHGTLLATGYTDPLVIDPGATVTLSIVHTTLAGGIDRRDVGVRAYALEGSVWVDTGQAAEWDDVYFVSQAAYSFTFGMPTVELA